MASSASLDELLAPTADLASAGLAGGAASAAGGGGLVAAHVIGRGGSSSSWATTMLAGGVEWSATGRKGASLADLGGLGGPGTQLARRRATSRLHEMLFSPTYPSSLGCH